MQTHRSPGTLRADGFSYASRERNHCEQTLVSLSEPPSSAKDESIKFEPVKRVSKHVLALARAFSYVTAAFGRACCVEISREMRLSDVKCITWGVTYFAHAGWKIKRFLAVVSLSGSVGETNRPLALRGHVTSFL